METKHAILHRCNHVKEDVEREVFGLLILDGRGRSAIFNTWVWPKVTSEDDQPTEEGDISVPAT